MRKRKAKLPDFFRPLFWSYRFESIDPINNKKRVIINTINYGEWRHWQWIIKKYGKKEVKRVIKETPLTEFRPQALQLICLLLGIKKLKYASRSDKFKRAKNS